MRYIAKIEIMFEAKSQEDATNMAYQAADCITAEEEVDFPVKVWVGDIETDVMQ